MTDRKTNHMDWFKIHHNGWLEGTLRYQPDIDRVKLAAFRGVMADLCALISRSRIRDGTLRHQVGLPMTRETIANILNIPQSLLNEFIEFGKKDVNPEREEPMVKEWDDGTLELPGWEPYQKIKTDKQKAKEMAKQVAIGEAKRTKKTKDDSIVGLMRAVNTNTVVMGDLAKKVRYIPTPNSEVLDTQTGELKSKELEQNES